MVEEPILYRARVQRLPRLAPDFIMPLDPAKIRSRREKLKLTQTDAAARAGILRPSWARVESGSHTNIEFATAEKIAKALDCQLHAIMR